jgi:hypothetical protein
MERRKPQVASRNGVAPARFGNLVQNELAIASHLQLQSFVPQFKIPLARPTKELAAGSTPTIYPSN